MPTKSYPQEAKERAKERGERIHSDVWGPARKETIGHARYYISFTDDTTRYACQKDCRLTEVDPRREEEDAEAEAQLKQGAEAPLQVKLNIEQHA